MRFFFRRHIQKIFVGACLAFVANAALLSVVLFPHDEGKFVVHFFNVGQGDSMYLRLPDEEDMVIDGGPDDTVLAKLGKAMPFYDHDIELLVLTHPHADHVTGLVGILEKYHVKKVLFTGVVFQTDEYLAFLDLLKEKHIEVEAPLQGATFVIGGVTFAVLHPQESLRDEQIVETGMNSAGGLNDTSLVLRAQYKNNSFLFTGDISSEIEKELLADQITVQADVLKVGHHGSKFSSSPEFIRAVHPQYAVIQVGRGNHYGHPAFRTLRTLEAAGVKFFRNDLDGDVTIASDGEHLEATVGE